jgi:hypothetical protein
MKRYQRVLLALFGVWLLVAVPWVAWAVVQTYVLNEPDLKFGASGGVMFSALISGLAGLIAGLCAVVALGIVGGYRASSMHSPAIAVLVSGISLSVLSSVIPHLPVLPLVSDVTGIFVSWAAISLAVIIPSFIVWGRK